MGAFPTLGAILAASVLAQAPAAPRDAGAERLELMKDSVRIYEITVGEPAAPLKLQPDPAFRLGDQGNGGILEGAIFTWAGADGRPGAAAQVFLHKHAGRPDGEWKHEFTSLSTRPLSATEGGDPRWTPDEPGVTFRPVPGAAKPEATAPRRLRQMRDLAAEFRAEDDFGKLGFIPLRLLPTPIARYGKPGGSPEDGALFAFVQGTDPEVFLFLEVRAGADGPGWQYAAAPMSCWALKLAHKGERVWSLPLRSTEDPNRSFFDRTYTLPGTN